MTVVDLGTQHPDTLTDYQRWRYLHDAPYTVACPHCNVPAGAWCKSSGGYMTGYHAKRIEAVAHLTDDQKIAARASQMAAESRRRIRQMEEADRRAADPVYQAELQRSRDWWNAQFRRVREEQRAEEREFRARCTDTPFPASRWHADDCRCRESGVVVRKYPPPKPVGESPVTDLSAVRARKAGAA